MIKLYGFSVSNYYCMVKLALLEKGVDFEEVNQMPGTDGDYLSKSPMGKVPCIETDQGFMSESLAIFAYLENLGGGPALMPEDPFAFGKCVELIQYCNLYIDAQGRRHFPEVFFGGEHSAAAKTEVKPVVEKALAGIANLGAFSPYMMGSEFTYADCAVAHTFPYAAMALGAIYDGWDIVGEVPGLAKTIETINARPHAAAVLDEQMKALEAFQAGG